MTFEEKTIESELLYKGAILNLRKDKVTVINGTSYREIIEHNGGAVIAPLTEDGKIIMVKQFRKPAERIMLEAPAGKRDGDVDWQDIAVRELKEETGYTAGHMEFVGMMYPTPGYSEEMLAMYIATDLTQGETNFDENEPIDIEEYSVEDLVDMVMAGEIEDAKTQIIILKTAEYIRRR